MDKKWFSFTAAAADSASADIYIFDYIGSWEISARSFIDELKKVEAEEINLHINSPGGSVFDGVAIQNSLKHHPAKVNVYIDGLAASIASIIALAGDEVQIADNAYVMIHNPSAIVFGEAKDMLKEAEVLDKLADGLAGDYSRKMGISVDEARSLMDEETWYLGEEAVAAGFADSVFSGSQASAEFNLERISDKVPQEVIQRFAAKNRQSTEEEVMSEKETRKQKTEDRNQDVEADSISAQIENKPADTAADATDAVDLDAVVKKALVADRKRQAEIRDIGTKFGFTADAEAFAASDKSVDDFRAHILAKSPESWQASLAIRNPSVQASESEVASAAEGQAAVDQIKARRQGHPATKS